jgi:hypothetical protein
MSNDDLSNENEVLSPEDRDTLTALLDTLIPASTDGRKPGAGALGIEEAVWRAVGQDPIARPVFGSLLNSIREAARGRGAETFAELDIEARTEIARAIESETPEAFALVVARTCANYYQNAEVVTALGLEARPPFPAGFEVAPTDPALLDPVRGRAPMYRKC